MPYGISKNIILSVESAKKLLKILEEKNKTAICKPVTLSDLLREGVDLVITKYSK